METFKIYWQIDMQGTEGLVRFEGK